MKAYPTVLTMPNRKQRKSQRKKIFAENSDAFKEAKKKRKELRRKINGNT